MAAAAAGTLQAVGTDMAAYLSSGATVKQEDQVNTND